MKKSRGTLTPSLSKIREGDGLWRNDCRGGRAKQESYGNGIRMITDEELTRDMANVIVKVKKHLLSPSLILEKGPGDECPLPALQ
jgi:hypothetical protein